MTQKRIVIDGKTYASVNEMPPDVRQKYEQAMNAFKDNNQNNIPDRFENMSLPGDKDNNGVPDIFENISTTSVISNSMKLIVNGQEFNSLEDLPPEARARYEQAMGQLDKNQNGVPDFLEGMMNMSGQSAFNVQSAPATPRTRPASRAPQTASPTIAPDTSNGWMLAVAGIVLLGICALGAAGVWYVFIR